MRTKAVTVSSVSLVYCYSARLASCVMVIRVRAQVKPQGNGFCRDEIRPFILRLSLALGFRGN